MAGLISGSTGDISSRQVVFQVLFMHAVLRFNSEKEEGGKVKTLLENAVETICFEKMVIEFPLRKKRMILKSFSTYLHNHIMFYFIFF